MASRAPLRALGAGAVVALLLSAALLLGSFQGEDGSKHVVPEKSSQNRVDEPLDGIAKTSEFYEPTLPLRMYGAASDADVGGQRGSTPRSMRDSGPHFRDSELPELIFSLIDACYEMARERDPELKGHLEMAIRIQTDKDIGSLVASAELNPEYTTLEDPEFLECASENVFAADELLERLREGNASTDAELRIDFTKDYPTTYESSGSPWPEDDASPTCPEATTAHGLQGEKQWCRDEQGNRHGPAYTWVDGRLAIVEEWQHGEVVMARRR